MKVRNPKIHGYVGKSKNAGKLRSFVSNWKKITKDSWVLSTIMGYQIESDIKPYQNKIPSQINFNNQEFVLIQEEI